MTMKHKNATTLIENHNNQEICRSIGQLETHIVTLNHSVLELKNSMDKVQTRVSDLERQTHLWKGGLAALAMGSAFCGVLFDSIIRWIFN